MKMTTVVLLALLGGFLGLLLYVYDVLVIQPKKLRLKLQKQGIKGPKPSHFLLGSMSEVWASCRDKSTLTAHERRLDNHNWLAMVFPFVHNWQHEFGSIFMYSVAHKTILCTSDVNMVREISMYKSLNLVKSSHASEQLEPLLGRGILTSNGSIWNHQRKIIAPELYSDKVKDMVKLMVESTVVMLSSWESKIENECGTATITVDADLKSLTADILSRACFGSSYSRGADIFSKIESLIKITSKNQLSSVVPMLRKLPTKTNREMWKLKNEIDMLILNLVKERAEASSEEKDLLQMILHGAISNTDSSAGISPEKFVVDNCKNIYFAGADTPAVSLVWLLFLLATNPDWQSRARAEVLHVCEGKHPDADSLERMKILTMVIQETLRLYPPSILLVREASRDITFNGVSIPKGVTIVVPIPTLHQDPQIWGADAHQFNPERFAHGLARACKTPQVYVPFGFGKHVCTGKYLSMTELKVITSLLLSKFQFSLSPLYVHSPVRKLLVVPQHGLTLSVARL